MKTLLSKAQNGQTPISVVPLLGNCIDVTLRLKNVKDENLKKLDTSLKV